MIARKKSLLISIFSGGLIAGMVASAAFAEEPFVAPDNFFYNHAFTMFNAEPFTHTGALGEYAAGDVTLYGGWTLGWDTGFNNNDNSGTFFLGGLSGSVPFYDGGGWAARYQGNFFVEGMRDPFANRTDVTIGLSGMAYLQSISGNAVGIGGGYAKTEDRKEAYWGGVGAQFSAGQVTTRADIYLGKIDFPQFNQDEDFWALEAKAHYYAFNDQLAIGGFGSIGNIDGNFSGRQFRRIGAEVLFQPPQLRCTTIIGTIGHTTINYDQPFINDVSYTSVGLGIRVSFNPAEMKMPRKMTLREQEVFNTPFDIAPQLIRYDVR